jgi:hypothetical protein
MGVGVGVGVGGSVYKGSAGRVDRMRRRQVGHGY